MGQIRKVGDTYYIEFFARGLLYSQIAGSDLAVAQKLLEDTEKTIASGEALTVVRQIDLSVFVQQFLDFSESEFGPKTSKRFRDLLTHFQRFLSTHRPDVTKLSDITPSVLEDYKASRSPSTKPHLVNFSILLLRDVLDFGIKLGFINDNPTVHIRLLDGRRLKCKETARFFVFKDLFSKGVGLAKASKLTKLTDIGRAMHYANLIPLSREDMYN